MLTQKDYLLLASVIKTTRNRLFKLNKYSPLTFTTFVEVFIETLETNNKKFDADKFIDSLAK